MRRSTEIGWRGCAGVGPYDLDPIRKTAGHPPDTREIRARDRRVAESNRVRSPPYASA